MLPLLLALLIPPCLRRCLPVELFDSEAALRSVMEYAEEVTGVRLA